MATLSGGFGIPGWPANGESFGFLGFEFRRVRSRGGVWRPHYTPQIKKADRAGTQAQGCIPTLPVTTGGTGGDVHQSDPAWVGELLRDRTLEPVFGYVRTWVEKKLRRHMMRARHRRGFGWKRWSTKWLYDLYYPSLHRARRMLALHVRFPRRIPSNTETHRA